MKITVVGAGNMGLAITGYISLKQQYEVILFTNKNVFEHGQLTLKDNEHNIIHTTDKFIVTSHPEEAFFDTDIVLCTYPAFLRKQFINSYKDYLSHVSFLGFVPGYGGIEYSCNELIKKGVTVFGFQRVPYVARAYDSPQGKIAEILSCKNNLYLAAIPAARQNEIQESIEKLFDIPCINLKEYLAVTLAPSNPLLHLTGLFNIFKNFKNGMHYDEEYLFYEQWNDETSEILLNYDDELQQICSNMKPLNLYEIVPLRTYYESPTAKDMTLKLKSINAFKCVKAPMLYDGYGWIPDFSSRMFAEDFPYGICIIKSFAQMTKTKTPTIDMILEFYTKLTGIRYFNKDGSLTDETANSGIPNLEGLDTLEKIVQFYHPDNI